MSEKYIEKTFLYFVALSLLLHVMAYIAYRSLPEKRNEVRTEPLTVDLSDVPELNTAPKIEKEVKRYSDRHRSVVKETAPRGERERDKTAVLPGVPFQPVPSKAARPAEAQVEDSRAESMTKSRPELKPKGGPLPELSKLYPSADRLARLEESYRKKYETEIEEGETKFLNTDDIRFGSFLKRFENAVYGVWRYPAEAVRAGIQGVTPVRITFNRKGEIEDIQLLQSSGSQILDAEVFRTLRAIGPIGGLPKGYDKEQFNLIAFFEYGLVQGGISRGLR